jgi:hypothetical protein
VIDNICGCTITKRDLSREIATIERQIARLDRTPAHRLCERFSNWSEVQAYRKALVGRLELLQERLTGGA